MMTNNSNNEDNAMRRRPRRRVRPDGVIEEFTAMGRVFTIPSNPHSLQIDLDADAPGWQPLDLYLRRLRG